MIIRSLLLAAAFLLAAAPGPSQEAVASPHPTAEPPATPTAQPSATPAAEPSATPAAEPSAAPGPSETPSAPPSPSAPAAPAPGKPAGPRPARPQPTLVIPRVSRPPRIEDFLTGQPREAEAHVTGFRQYTPGDGVPVSQPTDAYVSYDAENLYVVFVCKDDPAKIRAHMTKREDFFVTDMVRGTSIGDDFVSVNLDTFLDRRRAFVFMSNPLGIQRDGIYTVGRGTDVSFDAVWSSSARLTADGYIVRFALPFKSLRFHPTEVQTWGIALGRIISRTNEVTFWPTITRRVEGLVQQCATLKGIESVTPGRNLQIQPHGRASSSRFLDPQAAPARLQREDEGTLGADFKAVFNDAVTLDVTANPDFSQVESDAPQVTVNQRFEVFFPERRPFFLENAGFFHRDDVHGGLRLVDFRRSNLFFSRRIADPQLGARLTGRAKGWAFGALAIDDRQAAEAAGLERSGRAGIGVFRVQRELGAQSNVGVLFTSRDFRSSSNRVAVLDGRYKLSANWVVNGEISRTFDTRLDGRKRTGPGYLGEIFRSGKHFNYTGRYLDRSPDYRTALGFVPRVDVRQTEHTATYHGPWKKQGILDLSGTVAGLVNWARDGRQQDRQLTPTLMVEFPRQTIVSVAHARIYELYKERGFDVGFDRERTTLRFTTQWSKFAGLTGVYEWGRTINYRPAPGVDPFLGSGQSLRLVLMLRPGTRFRLEQTYIYTGLNTRDEIRAPSSTFPRGMRVFDDHILRSRFNYQINRELSVRAILDYNAVKPTPGLIELTNREQLMPDLLVTYLLNPGTAFYAGYSDRYENLDLSGDPVRRTNSLGPSTGRLFFVKMSWLFRR